MIDIKNVEEVKFLKMDEAIHFNEENLMKVLDLMMFHKNVDRTGDEFMIVFDKAEQYMKDKNIENSILLHILDFIYESADKTSEYAYSAGFKEGVRLLKTLLQF